MRKIKEALRLKATGLSCRAIARSPVMVTSLFEMPEYSISQLDKFEECALQYKFIYVDGIKRELKALGVWSEVAMLDPFALEKTVAEGKWVGDVLERIKAYVGKEKRYTVTLSQAS